MLRLTRILALVLLTLSTAACDQDATSPAAAQETGLEGEPKAYADMTDRELMIAMLVRMDSLEARVERAADGAVAEVVAALGDGTLALARADRERSRGTEQCLEIKLGSEAKVKFLTTLRGDAWAGLGAWAGSGATANLMAKADANLDFDPVTGGIEVKKSWCFGRGATRDPIVGSDPGTAAVRVAADPQDPQRIESELDALIARLGLNEARASQALSRLSDAAAGVPPCRPGDCARQVVETLPLPADLRSMLNDPGAFIRQRAPDYADFALDHLCDTGFPEPFGTRLAQACDIRDRVPDTAELFDTYESLVGIPDLVMKIDDRLALVCSRTGDLISGINGFGIEKHSIFTDSIRWPGPRIEGLRTNCTVLRSD